MKFNVTFRCALPIDLDKHPKGEELAEFLADRLREEGIRIREVDNYEDFAWTLDFDGTSPIPWIMVGYVGDGVFEWLVCINSGVGWFGRLLGRSDEEFRERLAEKVHAILNDNTDFSEIRWHAGGFSENGWTPSPA